MISGIKQAGVVKFHSLASVSLKNRRKLKNFLKEAVVSEGKSLQQLEYIFCSDDYLLDINKRFLKHQEFTDIITFDYSQGRTVAGEIYISVDRVRENAESFDTTFDEELHRVMFHGALHLCGYKDKTQNDSSKMRLAENSWLKKYFD